MNVNGALYDVWFINDTCALVFSGCDDDADFAFHSEADALAAGHALFDQVFVDGPLGAFDTNINSIAGCTEAIDGFCRAYIPFSTGDPEGFQLVDVRNANSENTDLLPLALSVSGLLPWGTQIGGIGPNNPHNESINAKFYATGVRVPEPTSLLLLGAGVVATLASFRSSRQQSLTRNGGRSGRLLREQVGGAPPEAAEN